MLTPLTRNEALKYLSDACREVLGPVSDKTIAIYAAQSALETGQWQSMHGWSFGNIRGSYRGKSQVIKGADEIIDGKRVTGPSVEHGFAEYPDAETGAREFVRFVAVDTTPNNGRPNRYHLAAAAALEGDVPKYVRELKAAGYFTASERLYLKGMTRLVGQMMKALQELSPLEQARARLREALELLDKV